MADDLSGLMEAFGVNSPYVFSTPGSLTAAAPSPASAQSAQSPVADAAPQSARGGIGDKDPYVRAPVARPSLAQLHASMPDTNRWGGAAGTSRFAPGFTAGGSGSNSDYAAYQDFLKRQKNGYRDAAADQLLRLATYNAYGGPDEYLKALQQAQGRTDENGARVGSADFQAEAAQKGYDAMQAMPELQQWGLANYDWSKLGVTPKQPSAAAASPPAPAQKMPSPSNQQLPQAFRTPQALKRATIGKRRSGGI